VNQPRLTASFGQEIWWIFNLPKAKERFEVLLKQDSNFEKTFAGRITIIFRH